jgi:AraC family transcriptional activator of tynA and feaB
MNRHDFASTSTPSQQRVLSFSTQYIPLNERRDWWREVICRHYANVDITSTLDAGFQAETHIALLKQLQVSRVRSGAISIKKRPRDVERLDQDAYFVALLVSGQYRLEQHDRIATLQPGEMVLYDATQPHRIDCAGEFSKLIFAIPRSTLLSRFSRPDRCTAVRMQMTHGTAAVAANFLRTWSAHLEQFSQTTLDTLCETSLDLLGLALADIQPSGPKSSRSQTIALFEIKRYIEHHLSNPELNTAMISAGVGLSPRYINALFARENQSLMRYVLQHRLDRCHRDIANSPRNGLTISNIAFRWGFNDLSHFSRVFRKQFGLSPRQFRETMD